MTHAAQFLVAVKDAFIDRTLSLIGGPTRATRFMLGVIGALWAIGLLVPGDTFERPAYAYMRMFDMGEMHWIVIWSSYSALMFYGVYAKHRNQGVSLITKMFGLALFSISALALYATRTSPFPAALACDIGAALAAFWVLIRWPESSDDV